MLLLLHGALFHARALLLRVLLLLPMPSMLE